MDHQNTRDVYDAVLDVSSLKKVVDKTPYVEKTIRDMKEFDEEHLPVEKCRYLSDGPMYAKLGKLPISLAREVATAQDYSKAIAKTINGAMRGRLTFRGLLGEDSLFWDAQEGVIGSENILDLSDGICGIYDRLQYRWTKVVRALNHNRYYLKESYVLSLNEAEEFTDRIRKDKKTGCIKFCESFNEPDEFVYVRIPFGLNIDDRGNIIDEKTVKHVENDILRLAVSAERGEDPRKWRYGPPLDAGVKMSQTDYDAWCEENFEWTDYNLKRE